MVVGLGLCRSAVPVRLWQHGRLKSLQLHPSPTPVSEV